MGRTQQLSETKLPSRRRWQVALVLGLAGTILFLVLREDGVGVRPTETPLAAVRDEATFEQLYAALAEEARSRHQLADQVAALAAEVLRLQTLFSASSKGTIERNELVSEETDRDAAEDVESGLIAQDNVTRFDDQILVSLGIHASEVERLHDRWAEQELEIQTIADNALREGWFFTDRHRNELQRAKRELREDLSDEDYDRYLYALGKPNRVVASEILPNSAASDAGLRRGDVILHYGDVRIFNPGEVLIASAQVASGSSATLVFLRDGRTRKVYVASGVLGVILEPSSGVPISD